MIIAYIGTITKKERNKMERITNQRKLIVIPSINGRKIKIPYEKLEFHIIKYLRYENHDGYNNYLERLMDEDDFQYNRFILYLESLGY